MGRKPHPTSARTEADVLEHSMISRFDTCWGTPVSLLRDRPTALALIQSYSCKDAPARFRVKGRGYASTRFWGGRVWYDIGLHWNHCVSF